MIKYSLRTLLIAGLFPLVLTAQVERALITGKITEARTGLSLPGIVVAVGEESSKGTVTDENGHFRLDVMPGEFSLLIKSLVHFEKTIVITIQPNETRELNIELEPRAHELKTFVTTASRYEQNIEELTVSMDVLRPNIIENKNTTSIQDALQQVPGVSIVNNEPQIRSGSGFSFGAGSRVMILVDDLPILSGDAGRPTWGFLPVENVEQVEVIKGAASVLYGSAALSGVMHIRTAYPRDTPQTKINLFSGVYNDPKNKAAIYWGRNNPMYSGINFFHSRKIKNLDLVIGGNLFSDDGYKGPAPVQGIDTAHTKQYREFGNRVRLNFSLRHRNPRIKGLSYGLNANGMLSQGMQTLMWLNADTGMYRVYPGAVTYTRQQIFYLDPYIQYLSRNGWKQVLRNRYYHLNNINDNEQSNQSDLFYSEYQLQKHFTNGLLKGLAFTSGLVNIYTQATSELYKGNLTDTAANEQKAHSRAHNMAAYLQLEKTFFNRITLNAGVRYEQFAITNPRFSKTDSIRTTREGQPVFRAGMNIKITRNTFFRISYGQGFRFPTIAEKYIRTQVGPIRIYPNDTLRSESSYNAEAAVKQGFRIGNFQGYADIAYFLQRYKNTIEFNFGQIGTFADPLFGLGFASLNIGNTRVRGWEATLAGQGRIGKTGIQLLAGYTYTNPVTLDPQIPYPIKISGNQYGTYNLSGSDSTGNRLKYRFQHLAKGDIELTRGKWMLGASIRYNSFMQNIDRIFNELDDIFGFLGFPQIRLKQYREEHNKGTWVTDARLSYQVHKTARISFIVNNLFNTEYMLRPMLIEQPRTTAVQFTITF